MFNNPYNYVRVTELQPISIESLGILVTVVYFLYLALRRQASLEIAYFLALPFSDEPFRIASSVQPVEALSMLLVALNYRKIRLNYVILIGAVYVLFSLVGYAQGTVQGVFSLFVSLKFLLLGLTFSVLIKRPFTLPLAVMRFAVTAAFGLTCLQVGLWIAGLPIHGVFYAGVFPRPKGLAHEPATWSIFLLSLFPLIYHFKLGRRYLWMNAVTLAMTQSTFGLTCFASYLALRWLLHASDGMIRIKKSFVRTAGAVLILALGLIAVKPDLLAAASGLLAVMDKLASYQQELLQFSGGSGINLYQDVSGRGTDFNYVREVFPQHWLAGRGSFSSPYDVISGTNLYLMLPAELGLLGTLAFFAVLFLHYRVLLRDRQDKSPDLLAFDLNLLLMIAGIRCFGFSEVWYIQAATLRTSRRREEAVERAEETPPPLVAARTGQ